MLNESLQRSANPSAPTSPSKELTDSGLLALLGPNVSHFPFSEGAFIETMRMKSEQERTKQEYYRAETATRNLSIVQYALQAQVPGHLIPQLCVSNALPVEMESQKFNTTPVQGPPPPQPQPQPQPQLQMPPQVPPQVQPLQPSSAFPQPYTAAPQAPNFLQPTPAFQTPISQEQQLQLIQKQRQQELQEQNLMQNSRFLQTQRSFLQRDPYNANTMSPMGFRFGAGSSGNNARSQSPAKIGAAAVANLATPTAQSRRTTTMASAGLPGKRKGHQRHNSMPATMLPNPPSGGKSRGKRLSNSHEDENEILQSPLGAQSTLQVNPIPAQPLHKQSKLSVQPSQESMTSFQHIIQFHHWKPENESNHQQQVSGSSSNKNFQTFSAKRRKQQPQPQPQPQQPLVKEDPREHLKEEQPLETKPEALTRSSAAPEGKEGEGEGEGEDADADADADDNELDADLSADATMDYSSAAKGEVDAHPPSQSHARQQSNVGRYPHDILSNPK
ncbi:uncharacterized protein LODBEIA_P01140 [Lodderomyces beijingensis]|uniref:Uncharacterized protein n=1 Tax=Lodderomyces beijingensis TaxID=1775926 RepID=A0ABP0ZCI2_9ASCO